MRLNQQLVLVNFMSDLLGATPDAIADGMRRSDEGRRPDGQSNFYTEFERRRSTLLIDLDDLKRYDLNILGHEAAIAKARPDFRLKYFQYLALLFTEIYLHRLSSDPAQLLLDLDGFRAARYGSLPPYTPAALRRLAFFMATGAGKTLVMHLNIRQFLHYKLFDPDSIIVLTPTETLARQHLDELHRSGIAASYALDGSGLARDVKVLEITKLYVDGGTTPKGGVSIPTSQFSGRNLLLVDEGHKGTATKSEKETERAWRDIREALVGDAGFTLEYSATFAQVTDNDDALLGEYARSIAFEYAYARFHGDRYGKDYRIFNLAKQDDLYGDTLLMAGLLAAYEKRRYYDDQRGALAPYLVESPLLVFVGAQVTAGPEVLTVVRFLDRVLRDDGWARETIERLLIGASGLPGRNGGDAFADAFAYLKELQLTPSAIYGDLCRRVFRGTGRLTLHQLKRADGEIGIRSADSAQDSYCGVINVGEAAGFLRKVRAETDIVVGEDDHLAGSLFAAINAPESRINLLIGSKKFIEGWSSWRVSVMGLLKVGTNAGAQVIQLFGRGVRLKGRSMSLQRSDVGSDTHPRHIALLETLHIFGLRSDYLDNFLRDLDREGIVQPELRHLPLTVDVAALAQAELRALEVDRAQRFAEQVVAFDPEGMKKVAVDLNPRLVVSDAATSTAAATRYELRPLPLDTRDRLSYDELFDHALNYKRKKGWENLYISRATLRHFFATTARIAAPPEVLQPTTTAQARTLEQAARVLVEAGLERFHYEQQERWETAHLRVTTIDGDHPNFPRMKESPATYAYELRVPPSLLPEVEAIIADAQLRLREDTSQPLPRLYVDVHLFNPLLLLPQAKGVVGVKSSPAGLEPSEQAFIADLRTFWQGAEGAAEWQQYELYVLRNLPRTGVGFFATAGFYPDFLLWLKRGAAQALAFIDPKGLGRWSEEKVQLLTYIRAQSERVGLPMAAYIVTPTDEEELQIPDVLPANKAVWLKERHVLHQQDDEYIAVILGELRELLS